jgi:hypothetical protein
MNDKKRSRGCIGCCLGVAGLGMVVVLAGFLLWAFEARRPVDPVERRLEHPLAAVGVEVPDLEAVEAPPVTGDPRPWTLALDLRQGSFTVEPADPGAPLSVEARYDQARFELVEEADPVERTYRLRFSRKRGPNIVVIRNDGFDNEVRVRVPRGIPVAVTGEIEMGQSRVDLSGLWVSHVGLEMGMGVHTIELSEATAQPLDSFRVESAMGQVRVRGLGFASPRQIDLDHSFGELEVDLGGPWRGDAEMDLDFSMGQARVILPRDAAVRIDRQSVQFGEARVRDTTRDPELPAGAPELALRLSGRFGELRADPPRGRP